MPSQEESLGLIAVTYGDVTDLAAGESERPETSDAKSRGRVERAEDAKFGRHITLDQPADGDFPEGVGRVLLTVLCLVEVLDGERETGVTVSDTAILTRYPTLLDILTTSERRHFIWFAGVTFDVSQHLDRALLRLAATLSRPANTAARERPS